MVLGAEIDIPFKNRRFGDDSTVSCVFPLKLAIRRIQRVEIIVITPNIDTAIVEQRQYL